MQEDDLVRDITGEIHVMGHDKHGRAFVRERANNL